MKTAEFNYWQSLSFGK